MYNQIFTDIQNIVFNGQFPDIYSETITGYIATAVCLFTAFLPYVAILLFAWVLIKRVI